MLLPLHHLWRPCAGLWTEKNSCESLITQGNIFRYTNWVWWFKHHIFWNTLPSKTVCIEHINNFRDGSPSASKHIYFLFLVLSVHPTAFTLSIHHCLTGAISDLSFTVGSLTYLSIFPHLWILPSINKCYYSVFLSFLNNFLFVLSSGFVLLKNAGPQNIMMLMQSTKHPNYTFQVFSGSPWKAIFSMSKSFHILI